MLRADEVSFELDCGARVTIRVIVDTAECRRRDGQCWTAERIAAQLWPYTVPELAARLERQ